MSLALAFRALGPRCGATGWDSEKRDSEKRDSEKRNSEKRNSEKRNSEKRDSEKRDSEKRDSEKRDSEKRDSEKRDSEKGGGESSHFLSSPKLWGARAGNGPPRTRDSGFTGVVIQGAPVLRAASSATYAARGCWMTP